MKRILFTLLSFASLLLSVMVKGQTATFTTIADTVLVSAPFSTTCDPTDYIINISANPVTLKWHVINSNFPSDWLTSTAFGICDNFLCRYNSSNQLWNVTSGIGSFYYSNPYPANTAHSDTGGFNLALNFSTATDTGTKYVTVSMQDTATSYSKTITFLIDRVGLSVPMVNNVNEILLYPNPASNEINLVYDQSADVKNIAIYNIIGKLMSVYKVAGNSANVSIDNMPSGVYFVRMVNSQGNVIATKRFTKM